jgi:hypothetical protein
MEQKVRTTANTDHLGVKHNIMLKLVNFHLVCIHNFQNSVDDCVQSEFKAQNQHDSRRLSKAKTDSNRGVIGPIKMGLLKFARPIGYGTTVR